MKSLYHAFQLCATNLKSASEQDAAEDLMRVGQNAHLGQAIGGVTGAIGGGYAGSRLGDLISGRDRDSKERLTSREYLARLLVGGSAGLGGLGLGSIIGANIGARL